MRYNNKSVCIRKSKPTYKKRTTPMIQMTSSNENKHKCLDHKRREKNHVFVSTKVSIVSLKGVVDMRALYLTHTFRPNEYENI